MSGVRLHGALQGQEASPEAQFGLKCRDMRVHVVSHVGFFVHSSSITLLQVV